MFADAHVKSILKRSPWPQWYSQSQWSTNGWESSTKIGRLSVTIGLITMYNHRHVNYGSRGYQKHQPRHPHRHPVEGIPISPLMPSTCWLRPGQAPPPPPPPPPDEAGPAIDVTSIELNPAEECAFEAKGKMGWWWMVMCGDVWWCLILKE